jgi:excisionase family DNA binding protein
VTDFVGRECVDSPSRSASRAKRLVRTREAAAYLSLSAWKLRSLVAEGELPVVQADDSSPFLFDVRDLDSWAERHKRIGSI